jgi:hypothetical protein
MTVAIPRKHEPSGARPLVSGQDITEPRRAASTSRTARQTWTSRSDIAGAAGPSSQLEVSPIAIAGSSLPPAHRASRVSERQACRVAQGSTIARAGRSAPLMDQFRGRELLTVGLVAARVKPSFRKRRNSYSPGG